MAMALDFLFCRWYKVVMMVSAVKVMNCLRRKAVRKKKSGTNIGEKETWNKDWRRKQLLREIMRNLKSCE